MRLRYILKFLYYGVDEIVQIEVGIFQPKKAILWAM
jgi:hypothetical protein